MIVRKGGAEILVLIKDKYGRYLEPYIKRKVIDNNENIIIIFTGRPRVGKSNSCLVLAESLKKYYGLHFDGTKHIAMGTLEFMKILKSKPKAGTIIIYEEAPVGHNSRQWHSRENEMLNNILNTFGFMRYVIIMNGVNFSDLDKQARKLIHMNIECYRKDQKNKKVYASPSWVKYVDEAGKFFRTMPRDKYGAKIKHFIFGRCSRKLWKQYEHKKFEWNYKNLDNMLKEAKIMYGDNVTDNIISYEEILKRVMNDPRKVIMRGSGKISHTKLNALYDLKPSLAKRYATKLNMEDIDFKARSDALTYKAMANKDSQSVNKNVSYIDMAKEKNIIIKDKNHNIDNGTNEEGDKWTPKVMKRLNVKSDG